MVKTDKSLTVSYMASFALVVAAWGTAFPATTLLSEDFDDGVANGFTEVGGSWSASFGKYFQSMTYPQGPYRSWVAAPTEYTIEVDCRAVSGEQTKVIYAHADTGEEYRVDFWLDRSRLCMPAWGQWWWTRSFEVGGLNLSYARTYHVQIAVSLAGVRVWVDNVLQHDQPWVDGQPLGDAKVGVGTYAAVSGFDNLRVHSYAEDMLPTTWLFEDFNDRVADRFTPIGGEWGIIADEYV